MVATRRLVPAVLFATALAGCTARFAQGTRMAASTPFAMSDPYARIVATRLAILPAQVDSFEADVHLKITPHPEWARAAGDGIEAAFNRRLSPRGVRLFPAASVQAIPGHEDLNAWTFKTAREIHDERERAEVGTSAHPGVYVWRYPGPLAALRGALDADFALVSVFLDGDSTPGLVWGSAYVNGKNWLARRESTACIVDLRDGRAVWCNVRSIALKKIRTPAGAASAVDDLLESLALAEAAAAPQSPAAAPQPGAAAPPAKQAVDPESE